MMETNKYDTFIKGENIDLICLTEDIVVKSNWYNWFNDEETTQNMQKHYFPNTISRQLRFFKTEIEENINKLQLGILFKKDSIMIGTISLNQIDYINRSCEIAGLIGEKKYRNFMNYLQACELLISHAFDSLNMHRIYGGSTIKEVNDLFCRALGFKQEGVQRECVYKNGLYQDVYLIGLLKEDYLKRNSNKKQAQH